MRLWTSLLHPLQAPAAEWVKLYASRWEQELYFRELKKELDVNDLLRSQTLETAAQEVATRIIGSSLVAGERARLRPGEELCHRISFRKTWETLAPLWLTLLLGADILSEEQKQALCERFYDLAARRAMNKRRHRSCPRVLRRPVQILAAKEKPKRVEWSAYRFHPKKTLMKLPNGIRLNPALLVDTFNRTSHVRTCHAGLFRVGYGKAAAKFVFSCP